jgi:ATP phosphoribosyltransferase regulatory subunit
MDLRQLHGLLAKQPQGKGVRAPHLQDEALSAAIAALREQGETVVVDLLGKTEFLPELNCDRELLLRDGRWQVVALKN